MTSPLDSSYREIVLTQGQVAIVDAEDYPILSAHNWYAKWSAKMGSYYAARNEPLSDGKQRTIRMHREILGLKHGDKRHSDHALHVTLDNRRFVDGIENLRIADRRDNLCNRLRYRNNTSGFKGVSFSISANKSQAYIRIDNRQIHLGYRDTAEAAAELYKAAAPKYHGKFAYIGTATLPKGNQAPKRQDSEYFTDLTDEPF